MGIFFIKTTFKAGEYIADYLDYTKALEIIKTTEDDNSRQKDDIKLDRIKVRSRSTNEAIRQASNPSVSYKFTPKYEKALLLLSSNYLQKGIDYKGILEKGIKTTNHQKELEDILRKIIKEQKDNGSLNASTVDKFIKLFNMINKLIDEEKEINKIEGGLYYAGK